MEKGEGWRRERGGEGRGVLKGEKKARRAEDRRKTKVDTEINENRIGASEKGKMRKKN